MKNIIAFVLITTIILTLTSCSEKVDNAQIVSTVTAVGKSYDKDAFDSLLKAKTFSCGGTGAGGTMSAETKAYAKLMDSDNAKAVFHKLDMKANMQGKLYALCAFYYLDNDYYKYCLNKYSTENNNVLIIDGCKQYTDKLKDVIKERFKVSYKKSAPYYLKEYITRN